MYGLINLVAELTKYGHRRWSRRKNGNTNGQNRVKNDNHKIEDPDLEINIPRSKCSQTAQKDWKVVTRFSKISKEKARPVDFIHVFLVYFV